MRNGVLANYQIAVPSRINAGPRAPSGELGACERALANTPILESAFTGPDDFAGIDILRAIQSFDPCMPCTARMVVDRSGQVLERIVTTTGP
ncbi:MAG: nickel-dependent hydrogenase large subunit [Nannocystis sp.]|nr:nickel-dependent hydrogenase large subunit [Nannocystis sp.]